MRFLPELLVLNRDQFHSLRYHGKYANRVDRSVAYVFIKGFYFGNTDTIPKYVFRIPIISHTSDNFQNC